MKKIFFIIILIKLSGFSYSQNNLDSLRQIINTTNIDTLRISALISAGEIYSDSLPDSALIYYEKALKIAENNTHEEYMIKVLSSLASLKIKSGEYKKAVNYYEKEINICEKINDIENLKISVGNSGVLYYYLGNFTKAITKFYRLENIATELNDSIAISVAYTNIGNIYKKLNENKKALEFFIKNLEISEKIHNESNIANAYNNIGLIYQAEDNNSLAIEYFSKALKLFHKNNDKEGETTAYINIGLFFFEMPEYKKAEQNLKNALKLAEEINNNRLISESEYLLAELYYKFYDSKEYNYIKQKEYFSKAREYAENAYKTAKSYNYMNTLKKLTYLLIGIYKETGNTDKALQFAEEHIAIKDSLFSKQNMAAIQQANVKFEIYKNKAELSKKQQEIEIRNLRIKTQKNIIKYGVISAVIFFILTLFIVFQYLRVKKQKTKISELTKLQNYLINNLPAYIYLKDLNFKYQLVNNLYSELLGIPKDEFIGKSDKDLKLDTKYEYLDMQVIATNKPINPLTEKYITKDKKEIWISIKKVPYHNIEGKVAGIIGIVSDVTEFKKISFHLQQLLDKSREQNKIIERKNKDNIYSLEYAKTIQDAILPDDDYLKKLFDDFFIIYKGNQIVSGDFYYAVKVKDTIIFALADCTGHGVPGGFLTMLSISFLNQIILDCGKLSPDEILNELQEKFIKIFSKKRGINKNGLDIGLCSYNTKNNILQFSGIFHSLYLYRNNSLTKFKSRRIPFGFKEWGSKFKNTEINIQKNDILYMFTDGIMDQTGGIKNKKFTQKRVLNLITEVANLSFHEQKNIIEKTIDNWMGDNIQIDDIAVFAFKL